MITRFEQKIERRAKYPERPIVLDDRALYFGHELRWTEFTNGLNFRSVNAAGELSLQRPHRFIGYQARAFQQSR